MNKNDFKQKITKRRYSRPLYSSQTTLNTHNKPTKTHQPIAERPQKGTNRLSQTPNSHDKPNNFANPTPTLCQPQHTTSTLNK
ncbi:hypothetical protein, partial [Corynebacterium sp. HMSC08A12]|uniref:hypothetical protein n=1 Tax=Corynebacterium sp. HMSC08A12 TaxID=1581134 RepID=UPI001AEFAEBE